MGPSRTHRIAHHTAAAAVAAFTLVEVIIAVAVISVITAVVLSGNSTFNKSVLLNQAAYSLAASIREAQSMGIANQGFADNAGHGISIAIDSTAGTKTYTMFVDGYPTVWDSPEQHCFENDNPSLPNARPGNCIYDAAENEQARAYTLKRDIKISALCGDLPDGTPVCTPLTNRAKQTCAAWPEGGITGLSILFARPGTEAMLRGTWPGGFISEFTSATIAVEGPDQTFRYVTVRDTGQVRVHATCP